MNFRQLEYFVEIVNQDNNITKAANKLYVSQSAVNQYLLKLEEELGTELFLRRPKHWSLTEAGKVYYEGAKQALLIKKDTYSKIFDITQSRSSSLHIGLTTNRGLKMFTDIFPELQQDFPNVTFVPYELVFHQQMEYVEEGKIDVGFIIVPSDVKEKISAISLGKEEMVLIVPSGHKVCEGYPRGSDMLPTLDIRKVADLPFTVMAQNTTHRMVIDRIFAESGITPKIMLETSTSAHVVRVAEACGYVGIVPRYYAETDNPAFCCFAMPDHPSWELCVTFRNKSYLSKAALRFIELTRQYWDRYLIPPQEN